MVSDRARLERVFDLSVSLALAFGVGLFLAIFVDLYTLSVAMVGQHPNHPWNTIKTVVFIGLLSSPTIFLAALWPIHLRQKRSGKRVFGWLPFVALASAVWMWFVYSALQGL